MPVSELLVQGLKLMGLGMGIVFCFLVGLVFTMQGMSWLARRLEGEEPVSTPPSGLSSQDSGPGDDLVAAIGAAVHSYRARHR